MSECIVAEIMCWWSITAVVTGLLIMSPAVSDYVANNTSIM